MYDFIKGKLSHIDPPYAVVENGGIGYRILIPKAHIPQLGPIGKELTLYISLVTKEDATDLYGFFERNARALFETLLQVSGIGPKLALSIVGHFSLPELHQAVANKEIKALCEVPGVGKKMAERLALELRDRLKKLDIPIQAPLNSSHIEDGLSALIHLGYTHQQAKRALSAVLDKEPKVDLSTLITLSLRHLS